MCSGITSGRVLDGELLYTKVLVTSGTLMIIYILHIYNHIYIIYYILYLIYYILLYLINAHPVSQVRELP